MDHGGNGQPVLPEATATVGRRGREAAALISLLLVLGAVWGATFFSMTRLWGEYRPATATLQEPPPPPTILVPSLTLDEAWDILGHAVVSGEDSDGWR